MFRLSHTSAVLLLAGVLLGPASVKAVVDTIDATVSAEVIEYLGADEGDFESSFENLAETTGNFPLRAEVALRPLEEVADEAGGVAAANFYDPRVSQTDNPGEFGLDVGAFSFDPDVSYGVAAASTELREIAYSSEEIDEPDGTELKVRSQFFLDGFLLIWGDEGQLNLGGTSVELELSVVHRVPGDDGGQPVDETVLEASLSLNGHADGTASLTAQGALSRWNVVALQFLDAGEGIGPMHVVYIPPTTALSYTYPAVVGEPFELEAGIKTDARCQPGTGVAAQLGVSLDDLAALVEEAGDADLGELLQALVESAVSTAPEPARPLLPASQDPQITVTGRVSGGFGNLPVGVCGSLGAEAGVLGVLLAVLACMPGRRVWPQ